MTRARNRAALLAAALVAAFALSSPAFAEPTGYGRIVGTITDAGRPVAAAGVTVFTPDGAQRAYTKTGADGTYAVPDLEPGTYQVRVDFPAADGMSFRQQVWYQQKNVQADATPVVVTDAQDTTVDEHTLPTGTLRVRIVDDVTGRPLPRYCVNSVCTTTGTVTIGDLLPGDLAWESTTDALHTDVSGSALITANTTTSVTARVKRAAAISTTVRDAATGAPIASTCVYAVGTPSGGLIADAHPSSPPTELSRCSDAQGRVVIGKLSAGDYRLFADPLATTDGDQWVGTRGGTGRSARAAVVTGRLGRVSAAPPIRIERGGAISGTVTDATTGQPIAGICAYPYARHAAFFPRPGCTTAAGTYTITGLGPYDWPVQFVTRTAPYAWQWSGGAADQSTATLTHVTAGATANLTSALTAGTTLSGHVTSPTSSSVYVYSAKTGDYAARYASVAADGSYSVRVLGNQSVKVQLQESPEPHRTVWFDGVGSFGAATPIAVPATGAVTGIDVTLPTS